MRLKINANSEGQSAGTVSDDDRSGQSESLSSGFGFSQSSEDTGAGGIGLSAPPGFGIGGSDIDDGDIPPSKRKRRADAGQKRGARKSASLTAAELDAARRKLRDTCTGVVGFSISYYGTVRANKYKKINPILARKVYDCYQIPKEAAESIGEPLAETFIEWFPQHVNTANKAIDPGLAVARLFTVLQQAHENEKIMVMQYHRAMSGVTNQPNTNGNGSEPQEKVEEPISEWMKQQSPTPEEILP